MDYKSLVSWFKKKKKRVIDKWNAHHAKMQENLDKGRSMGMGDVTPWTFK